MADAVGNDSADNLSKLQEITRKGGPLTQELLEWLAANTAAGGREVTDMQGRCSTELLHLDGAFLVALLLSQPCGKQVLMMHLH